MLSATLAFMTIINFTILNIAVVNVTGDACAKVTTLALLMYADPSWC